MRVQTLERALPAIAGFIAEKTGIEIKRGSRARTDGQSITLPLRRSELDMTEKDLVEAVAYCYHEVGHVLHSNFDLCADTPLKRALTGVLEDIRIEYKVQASHPSAHRYLGRLVEFMVAQGLASGTGFPPMDTDEQEAKLIQYYMMYKLRFEALKQKGVEPVLGSAEDAMIQRFPVGMRTRLDALMFEVIDCDTEDEVFALADAIIEMIKEEKQKEEEKQREDEKQGQDQPQGQQSDDGQPDSEVEQDPDENCDGEQSPDQNSLDSEKGKSQQALEQLLSMSDNDIIEDIGSILQQALNKSAAADQKDESKVQVRTPNVFKANFPNGSYDLSAIRAASNATRTRTLQWLSSVTDGDETHARSGMKIDPSRIWSGRLGGSVFVTSDDGIDTRADISFVNDRSISMTPRISQAIRATLACILAFDVPGIETQVSVFPWLEGGESGVSVIKDWNDSPKVLSARAASIGTDGYTPMAEAILFAGSEIIRRPKAMKIIIVVTDGEPDDLEATRHVIERCRLSGVVVCALGIDLDPSPVFGEKYSASLTSISELPSKIVGLVKQAFLEQKH